MDMNAIWQDYGLDRLNEGMQTLFPRNSLSLEAILGQVMQGDIFGAVGGLFEGVLADFAGQLAGMRNIFVWFLVLGIVSALMTHFVEIFDRRQVADISFYFTYLLFTVVLLKCFHQAASTAADAMGNVVLFIQLMIPAYLISLGISTGSVTAGASYQMMLLIIYGIQNLLSAGLLPLIYSMCMLVVINGVWVLKGTLGVVAGLSILQALITPVVDTVRTSALQKIVSAIPGVGNAADGVVEMVLSSAVMVKNSVGVVILLLFLVMCAAPLMKIAAIALLMKCSAAFMGIVCDKRITNCANRTGDAGMLLLRTAGTAMLLLLVCMAVITASM